MKAIVLDGVEAPLRLAEVEKPVAGPGEVVIKIHAAAFNRRDWWIQKGQYARLRFPIILGSDGSGIVAEIGEGVDNSWLNKEIIINPGMNWGNDPSHQSREYKILGLPDDGTFAEYVKVPVSVIHEKPAYLTWEEAASFPLAALTGYRALFSKGQVKKGDKVLVSGIGGGVALMVMQMAMAVGADVYVTSGSDEKIDKAVALGAKLGVNYKMSGWHKLFQSAVEGFDVIIDGAAGDGFKNFIDLANPGGRIVFYGGTQGPITTLNPQKMFWKQVSVMGTTMGTPEEFKKMLSLFKLHEIRPVIDRIFSLEEAEAAMRHMDESNQFGKIVLKIQEK